ncbi:MAG: hypothetical protein SPL96_05330 [Bacteroidales bacterium]|nr:hypothetical protein [Bacteroidales bacterium]
MPYSNIVTLRQMRPAYNIKEEGKGEWINFIANDQFNDILAKAISSVRNNDADHHKSLWIAGTYGTGKSHAGAVIKHLLCDPVEDMRGYVEDEYKKPKYEVLRESLMKLRETKRLFPVNLYGQQSIAHEEDLSLQMQREIKRALMDAGLDITVQTDFDTYVQHIESQELFWENLINQNAQLASVAPDVKKLKQRLIAADTDVLDSVRQALRIGGYDIRLKSNNLKQWIFEVQNELRKCSDYNGLLIIWDEFTEVMTSSIGVRLLVQLQEIAEAMMNQENDSYFLFISHPSALNSLKEDEREKTKGRYHYVAYNMEPVSAYRIMSKKFVILDDKLYQDRQNRFFNMHPELLDMFITASNSTDTEGTTENIKNLFPLHPGTANLATYYAREAGSSSRSVFEFLASDTIREFLDNEDAYSEELTITADYLWDYVREYFESDATRFGAVTERYNSHRVSVEQQNENYVKVFKGILLLNALNNIANSVTVTPSTENIENLFIGTPVESELMEILEFFNDKSIIQRQPNGNYSILFTALPGEEIQSIKQKLVSSSFLYTDQVIKSSDTAKNFFERNFWQVARPLNFQFFSTQGNEYTLMNKIESAKKQAQPYETLLAIMVARTSEELMQLKDIAERNCKDDRFKSIAFAVMDAVMGEKEYERFIDYQANAECAQKHGLQQQVQTYAKQASEMIQQWVTKMRSNNVTFYLAGDSMTIAGSKMTSTINSSIAPNIFTSGPESLDLIRTKSNTTYWKKASVKATVDAVLNYNTKQDIISKCGGPARHVEFLLQDSVDDNLEWKDTVSPEHPLKKVCDYVDEWLSSRHTNKNQSFNLGDKLIGLTEPPYGLFQSYAPMAMVAFAMRKYVNVIFDTNGKQRTAQHLVEDVVEMFKAWESGKTSAKLNFMFESKEAGRMCKSLINLFALKKLPGYSDISSLKDARWAVLHVFCKQKGYPLWSLKYIDECTPILKEFIDNLMKVVVDSESMKDPVLLDATLNGYDNLKTDFGNLLLPSEDNFRKGFNAYMKSVDYVNLQDDELDEALKYLQGHLESVVGMWTEDEVKDNLKNWRMSKTAQPQPPKPVIYPPTPVNPPVVKDDPDSLKSKRTKAINRINNSEDLRQAIENLINSEDSYIIDILLKYV